MRGDLSETGLEDIFGELAASGSTGALHLEGGTGPGKVFFRDGDVYYASSPAPRAQLGARLVGAGFIDDDELDRALAAQEQGPTRTKLGAILVDKEMVRRDVIRVFVQEQILDAVFDLARWDAGTFEFFRGDAVAEDLPVQIPTPPLLMEVRRRLSEWEDIRAVIPSLDAVPDFVRGGSTAQAALEPDEFTLLTSVDGRRSVRDLAHDLGYSQFDAARLIYGLSLLGVITLSDGEATTTASRDASVSTEPDTEATDPQPSPGPAPETAAAGAAAPTERPADTDRPEDTEEPEDVDIGKALEEALFGGAYDLDEEPARARDGDTDEPHPELDEGPAEDLEEVAREAARSAEDRPPPGRDLTAGSDDLEPEIWSASIDVDEAATEGTEDVRPEEPVAEDVRSDEPGVDDVRPEEPAARPQPQADSPRDVPEEAGPVRAGDTDDDAADARDELMALVGELQDVTSGEDAPEEESEAESEEEREEEPEVAAAETQAPGDAPEPAEPPRPRPEPEAQPDEPTERAERGDVSELLRELSRLAGGGPEPVAPTPDAQQEPGGPEDSAGPDREEPDEPQQPDEPRPRSADDDDDDDKRSAFRRLFGSR